MKIACTSVVHYMTCDTTGYYCIGALNDKINIWEVL